MDHGQKAAELFLSGYNCAQAVAVAFTDLTGLTAEQSARMISSFGGGMGRMREVCGAVSGMLFVAGILWGYEDPGDNQGKRAHYARVQELAGQFRAEKGSIICRELLGNPPADPNPSPRTPAYYASRPCAGMVWLAAELLDQYIAAHGLTKNC